MRLVELADSLERLEETRSRLRMVEHVAELLAHCARDERASIVYLLQARLRPEYEEIEVGLGEKLLVRALAKAYSVGDRRNHPTGDHSDVQTAAQDMSVSARLRLAGVITAEEYAAQRQTRTHIQAFPDAGNLLGRSVLNQPTPELPPHLTEGGCVCRALQRSSK